MIENLPLNDEDMKNLKLFDIILRSNMSMSTYNLLKKHFMPELSMSSIFILQARILKLSHVTGCLTIAVSICVAASPEPMLCLTHVHSVNTLSIIWKATHTKNTNIYLLNLTSNHST